MISQQKTLVTAAALAAVTTLLTGCSFLGLELGQGSGDGYGALKSPEVDGTLAAYQQQEIEWTSCGSGHECAKVAAPLDWGSVTGEPGSSESIELALRKTPSTSDTPLGTVFVNPGGPGAPGTEYLEYTSFPGLAGHYDVIAWDPRGVGSSSQVVCYDDAELDDHLFDTTDHGEPGSDEWLAALRDSHERLGAACLENTGELIKHVDTVSTVRDLDLLREIVGDAKLNYLGYSYGTYIGARYADMFPETVGRLVLDGALDPNTTTADVVRAQTGGFEQALAAFLESCLGDENCPFTGTVESAMAEVHGMLAAAEATPLPTSEERKVGSGTLLTAIITPLYAESNWPLLYDLFAEVKAGTGDTALYLADFYYDRDGSGEYLNNSTEAFIAINCLDYPNTGEPDFAAWREDAAALAKEFPTFGKFQGYADASCWGWPVAPAESRDSVTAAGADPILVIGTTGDPATPYDWAVSLAEQLESGVLVTYEGEGHTAYNGKNACVDETVNTYFRSGEIPSQGVTCSGGLG